MKNLEEIKDKFRLLWVIQIFDLQIKLQFTETRVESDVIEWPWTILTIEVFIPIFDSTKLLSFGKVTMQKKNYFRSRTFVAMNPSYTLYDM